MPHSEYLRGLQSAVREFLAQDAARRLGSAGDPAAAAVEDRRREGTLIARLLGPAAPAATVPVALAGAGFEGAKAAGLTDYLHGPLRTSGATSPASVENIIALLRGYTGTK